MKLINLVGHKFGKLTVISQVENSASTDASPYGKVRWLCSCSCGNTSIVLSSNLRGNKVVGCGKCRTNIGNQYGAYDLTTHNTPAKVIYSVTKYGAKKRGLEFSLTPEDVKNIVTQNCVYCGCPPHVVEKPKNRFSSPFIHNGIDRVDNNVGYVLDNCVPCCELCNRMKLTLHIEEFKNHIENIYNHWIKGK